MAAVVPVNLRGLLEGAGRAVPEIWRAEVAWRLDARAAESRRRLARYRDAHAGRRCFILGNGPSLGRMDLSPLRGEITFGTNRIYLLFEKMGFPITYYVASDKVFIGQFAGDIARLEAPKFLNWQAGEALPLGTETVFWNSRPYLSQARFSKDVGREIVEGSSVTYAAIQIARHMGFHEVILIGVDHSYRNRGSSQAAYERLEGSDLDHFDSGYLQPGHWVGRPDLKGCEAAYGAARRIFEEDGRAIWDATVSGKLEVFPKREYADFFPIKPR